jgi:pilus assembly protein CpaC
VSLRVTPTLRKGNRLGLHVRPEVSALSSSGAVNIGGFSVPALTVRRADTTVEVASGQTFAIAGLFQRNLSNDIERFPILGDVPILGSLFRSTRYRRDETELVILITPYLVRPVHDRAIATPLDRPAPRATAAQFRPEPVDAGQSGLVLK